MKNSVSDQSFYIESEDEEDEEKVFNRHEGEDDGNESDVSDSSAENQQQNKPSSYNTSWPQSYRSFLFSYAFMIFLLLCFSLLSSVHPHKLSLISAWIFYLFPKIYFD